MLSFWVQGGHGTGIVWGRWAGREGRLTSGKPVSGGGTESPAIKVLDWGVFGGKEEKAERKMTGLDGAVVTTCPEI